MSLQRSSSRITPSNYTRQTSIPPIPEYENTKLLVRKDQCSSVILQRNFNKPTNSKISFFSLIRSFINVINFPNIFIPTCKFFGFPSQLSITPFLGRKVCVTGTLFGHRRGHVCFAVQDDPRSEPVLLLELAITTSTLVKEMSSGLVRIALECERTSRAGLRLRLYDEPTWSMYCNGRKCGYTVSRTCSDSDWHVLSMVQTVSVGAGVIPVVDDRKKSAVSEGELLYMRAKFERVVGSRDSEAFYMLNPDGNGGPELSIFMLRI